MSRGSVSCCGYGIVSDSACALEMPVVLSAIYIKRKYESCVCVFLLQTNALSMFVPLIQSEEFDGAILADEENFTKQFIDDEWPDVRLIQRASFWRKLQRFRASSKTMTTSVEPEHAI